MSKHIYIATGVLGLIGGIATVSLVSCDVECTLEARPSVVVQFIDSNPSTASTPPKQISASEVWFEVTDDAGTTETHRGACMDDTCSEWILGYEKPGTYEIHATVCGQEVETTLTVEMTEDGCHVETEWAKLRVDASTCAPELDPPTDVKPPGNECTPEARYSVIVDVLGEIDGVLQPIATDSRYFKWSGETEQTKYPGVCIDQICSQFAAGLEQAGRFEVGAAVCGSVVAQTVAVEKTDDGCHVATERVRLVADLDKCDELPKPIYPPTDPTCTLEARASAIVMPVVDGGDVYIPYPTEQLWFEQGGTRHKATCAGELDSNGRCSRWLTGWELDGRFTAYTETCDEITKLEFAVGKTMDGCHVETRYIPMFMDTHGCIQSPQPPAGKPMLVYDAP